MNDDPREVLALLNSLGFVGITAQQLKGFMKDLKLYRKVKDREKQQRKEEIRRKIIEKQQNVIKEVLREGRREFCYTENTVSTDSNSYTDHSLVRVKVKCVSSDRENKESTNSNGSRIDARQKSDISKSTAKKASDHSTVRSIGLPCDDESTKDHFKSKDRYTECPKLESYRAKKEKPRPDSSKIMQQEKPTVSQPVRPMSAPNILEHGLDRIGSGHTKSTSSARNSQSGTKSFIRPWRLQPETQRALSVNKSDPVTLYQKYQQEWKQMSFPGEAKHASLRWAVREKMLGGDPRPMPLPRKSASMPILKKK